jgi:bifunctional DNA-binding transcriptional regulator/antitoxin component of YhaV-PrlF toxin-antitoxin module
LPENPVVTVSKILLKGVVWIPLEVREKLDLKLGTRIDVSLKRALRHLLVMKGIRYFFRYFCDAHHKIR